MRGKILVLGAALAFGGMGIQGASAAGCLSGGAAGAVVGHVAGKHAVLGAVGGCVAGHEINKHDQKVQAQQAQPVQNGAAKQPGS